MADGAWIIRQRNQMLRATTQAIAKLPDDKAFTVRELLKKVPRELNSYDRWMISRQRVTGAVTRLLREEKLTVVGEAKRKIFSANIYTKTSKF